MARAIQQRAQGRTLIMIAHRLSTIRNSDLILVLHDGRLVEQGSWEELVQKEGTVYRLHQAQFTKDCAGGDEQLPQRRAAALRDLGTGCQILVDLGLGSLRLLTSSNRPIVGIEAYGLTIAERVRLAGSKGDG